MEFGSRWRDGGSLLDCDSQLPHLARHDDGQAGFREGSRDRKNDEHMTFSSGQGRDQVNGIWKYATQTDEASSTPKAVQSAISFPRVKFVRHTDRECISQYNIHTRREACQELLIPRLLQDQEHPKMHGKTTKASM